MKKLLAGLLLASASAPVFAQTGSWGTPMQHDLSAQPGFVHVPNPAPFGRLFNSLHLSLIPQPSSRAGLVIGWDKQNQSASPIGWFQRWTVLDPSTNPPTVLWNEEMLIPGQTDGDLFCAGQTWTAAGKLFVAGGTNDYNDPIYGGAKLTFYYDPEPTMSSPYGHWVRLPDMAKNRWYPTVTVMGDGKLMVSGGTHLNAGVNSYEIFDPSTETWEVNASTGDPWFDGPPNPGKFGNYPRMHTTGNGRMFNSGQKTSSARLNHNAAPGQWVLTTPSAQKRHDGAAFRFPLGFTKPDVIVIIGGSDISLGHTSATNTMEWCLPKSGASPWNVGPSMAKERVHLNTVLLPDATVLAIGGNTHISGVDTFWKDAEWLDSTLTWRAMPDGDSVRDYHSAAVLLPNGNVLSSGGDRRNFDWQLLTPPTYDDPAKPRPSNVVVPVTEFDYYSEDQGSYSANFSLPPGRSISKVVLMAPGSTTHHSDFNQRYFELPILTQSASSVSFVAPFGPQLPPAPVNFTLNRGYYMLFLISDQNIPSEATFIKLD